MGGDGPRLQICRAKTKNINKIQNLTQNSTQNLTQNLTQNQTQNLIQNLTHIDLFMMTSSGNDLKSFLHIWIITETSADLLLDQVLVLLWTEVLVPPTHLQLKSCSAETELCSSQQEAPDQNWCCWVTGVHRWETGVHSWGMEVQSWGSVWSSGYLQEVRLGSEPPQGSGLLEPQEEISISSEILIRTTLSYYQLKFSLLSDI